jgi:hypothetical protein
VQAVYVIVIVIVNGEEDDVTYFELQPRDKLKKNFDISDSYSRGQDKSSGSNASYETECDTGLSLSLLLRRASSFRRASILCLSAPACRFNGHFAFISTVDITSQKYFLNI